MKTTFGFVSEARALLATNASVHAAGVISTVHVMIHARASSSVNTPLKVRRC
jgi:hypothetical protein